MSETPDIIEKAQLRIGLSDKVEACVVKQIPTNPTRKRAF